MVARLSILAAFCCTSMFTLSQTMFRYGVWSLETQVDASDEAVFRTTSEGAPCCEPVDAADIDFTLVTQFSSSRLFLMEEQCRRWGAHPISLALTTDLPVKAIEIALEELGCNPNLISIKTVHETGSYPVNKLRNLAFSGVNTSHAVYVDADFLVSTDLYQSLLDKRQALDSPKTALVLPAFELWKLCDPSDYSCRRMHAALAPDTKDEMLNLFSFPETIFPAISQFDSKGNIAGHGSTLYNEWCSQDGDELLSIDCFTSKRYEPYLVVQYCRELPPFQESFTGYGQNKLTWTWQLRHTGYSFLQIGDGFLVHFPHPKSHSFKMWKKTMNQKSRVNLQVEKLSNQFYHWLKTNVPDQSVVSDCPVPDDDAVSYE